MTHNFKIKIIIVITNKRTTGLVFHSLLFIINLNATSLMFRQSHQYPIKIAQMINLV